MHVYHFHRNAAHSDFPLLLPLALLFMELLSVFVSTLIVLFIADSRRFVLLL